MGQLVVEGIRLPSRRLAHHNRVSLTIWTVQMKPGETGLTRLISATRYSYQGIKSAWHHEAAFRQEATLAVVGILLAAWLARSPVDFLLLVVPLMLLLAIELLNSAIEAVVDRHGEEHHELAGRAKDMGSAAVFVAIGITLASWLVVLGSYLISTG